MTIYCIQPLNSVLLYQTVYYQAETIIVALPALHLHNRIEFSWFTYTSWMLEWRCWITTWITTNQHPGKSTLLLNAITIRRHLAFVHNLEHYEMLQIVFDELIQAHHCVAWWDTNELSMKKRQAVCVYTARDDVNKNFTITSCKFFVVFVPLAIGQVSNEMCTQKNFFWWHHNLFYK